VPPPAVVSTADGGVGWDRPLRRSSRQAADHSDLEPAPAGFDDGRGGHGVLRGGEAAIPGLDGTAAMRFDSDLVHMRAPYAGRHRKPPAYLRAASRFRLPHLTLLPLSAARPRPGPESVRPDTDWPIASQPAA
jgi:hypothetical protein